MAPVFQALTDDTLSLVKYPDVKRGADFEGYRGIGHLAHEGDAKVAEPELHHHAPS